MNQSTNMQSAKPTVQTTSLVQVNEGVSSIEFYLTEVFDDVYIQRKYEDVYLCFFVSDEQHDLNTMREDVSRILNSGKCNKKQKRRLVDALVVLDEIEDESKIYDIPPIHVLEENYWQLEEYRNRIYL